RRSPYTTLFRSRAACSDPQDPPAPDPDIADPELHLPAGEPLVDDIPELRSRWLELERPALTRPEPEPLPVVVASPPPATPTTPAEQHGRTPAVAIFLDDDGHNPRQ